MIWSFFDQYMRLSKDGIKLAQTMYTQWCDVSINQLDSLRKIASEGGATEFWLTRFESYKTYRPLIHVRNCAAPVYLLSGLDITVVKAVNDGCLLEHEA